MNIMINTIQQFKEDHWWACNLIGEVQGISGQTNSPCDSGINNFWMRHQHRLKVSWRNLQNMRSHTTLHTSTEEKEKGQILQLHMDLKQFLNRLYRHGRKTKADYSVRNGSKFTNIEQYTDIPRRGT